jgi:putative endonuclease
MPYKQQQGQLGEDAAAAFLAERGFTLLDRNYRCGRSGELDLVVANSELVVFVEVKKRSTDAFGGAIYSLSPKKLSALKRNARWYIAQKKLSERDILFRFDLIAIDNNVITWVQDILR